jgi:hypothetical protein
MMEKHEASYKDVSSLEVVSYFRHSSDFDDGVEFILEKLDTIPVADVQPVRHGKWVLDKPDEYGNRKPKCSVCGEYHLYSWSDYTRCNYCPQCGAKMDGE